MFEFLLAIENELEVVLLWGVSNQPSIGTPVFSAPGALEIVSRGEVGVDPRVISGSVGTRGSPSHTSCPVAGTRYETIFISGDCPVIGGPSGRILGPTPLSPGAGEGVLQVSKVFSADKAATGQTKGAELGRGVVLEPGVVRLGVLTYRSTGTVTVMVDPTITGITAAQTASITPTAAVISGTFRVD